MVPIPHSRRASQRPLGAPVVQCPSLPTPKYPPGSEQRCPLSGGSAVLCKTLLQKRANLFKNVSEPFQAHRGCNYSTGEIRGKYLNVSVQAPADVSFCLCLSLACFCPLTDTWTLFFPPTHVRIWQCLGSRSRSQCENTGRGRGHHPGCARGWGERLPGGREVLSISAHPPHSPPADAFPEHPRGWRSVGSLVTEGDLWFQQGFSSLLSCSR